MDAVPIGSAVVVAQLLLGGTVIHAFRRAWSAALRAPVEFPPSVASLPEVNDDVGAGAYLPDRRQALIAPALRDRRTLAALAVHLHEIGHREQHLARPMAVSLQWPLRMATTLTGGLGALLIVGGLLGASPSLRDVGMILFGVNVIAAVGLVILEWDASCRGIASANDGANTPSGLRQLLLLAALTYLALTLTLLLPIVRPETACSLPSLKDSPGPPWSDRHSACETRRRNNGEPGTGDSANQPGGAKSADGRDAGSHDRGRARPG